MRFIQWWMGYWDRKVRPFGILEIKLAQGAAMAFMLMIVKVFPELLRVPMWLCIAACAVLAARPMYVIFRSHDPE